MAWNIYVRCIHGEKTKRIKFTRLFCGVSNISISMNSFGLFYTCREDKSILLYVKCTNCFEFISHNFGIIHSSVFSFLLFYFCSFCSAAGSKYIGFAFPCL